jgi:hypothetical protein
MAPEEDLGAFAPAGVPLAGAGLTPGLFGAPPTEAGPPLPTSLGVYLLPAERRIT